MFRPNTNLVNEAVGGGLQNASRLIDLVQNRRDRNTQSELSKLAAGGGMLDNQHVANQAASHLFALGQTQQGFQAIGAPGEMERAETERQQFLANQEFDNNIAAGNLNLRQVEVDARLDPNSPFNNKPKSPLSTIGKINSDFKAGFIDQPTRDAAVAKANSNRNGIEITNPDGTVTRIGGTGVRPNKAATNQLQKGIISNTELLDLTNSVRESFNPDFLTFRGQGEQFFTRNAEKLGMTVGEARKQFTRDRTKFVTKTERLFNAYRKEITGAAAAVQELDRLKKSFLNTDQSPTEFEATLDSYQDELKRTVRLRNRLLREGLDPRTAQGGNQLDNLFLTGGDDDVEARGLELQREGKSEEEILAILDQEGY